MRQNLKSFLVMGDISVKEAMRQMSKLGERILFVVDKKESLQGSVSDGDIRRWVLKGGKLTAPIKKVCNLKPYSVGENFILEDIKHVMLKKKLQWIPVVNADKRIVQVLLWEHIFGNGQFLPRDKINIPVVIMAGGKGTRLDPFTRILPKPLIPIGEKAIIEVIMEKFSKYGVDEFYVSVNYKSRMIKAFFEETNTSYKINYIEEKKPLGTAGSLKLIREKVKENLFVSNCDIIIDSDYAEMIDFHKRGNYDMTIIGSFRHFTIPYGICAIEPGGKLLDITEKPEYDYLVNTGMYIIKQEALDLIPNNQFYNIPDLINKIKDHKGKIGVFPIDAKSWIDVGQWDEYNQSVRDIKVK